MSYYYSGSLYDTLGEALAAAIFDFYTGTGLDPTGRAPGSPITTWEEMNSEGWGDPVLNGPGGDPVELDEHDWKEAWLRAETLFDAAEACA